MHPLLSKLLRKRGIDKVEEMTIEEKKDFDNFERVLSKRELTIEDIKHFLSVQTGLIKAAWSDLKIPNEKKAELIPYYVCYETLLAAISAPEVEATAMERVLLQLIQ